MPQHVSVVVLGYGLEPYLAECLTALDAQLGADDELLLVDNGVSQQSLAGIPPRVVRVGDGANLGFAGGCNLGAEQSSGATLVFVNSDAIVRPGSLAPLVAAAQDPAVGIVGGCLRLADQPTLVNSAGNPLQFTGITWAGGCGDPATEHATPGPVAVATGGFFAIRREVWQALGGFDPVYFAYHEDTDLSVRSWLSGRDVRFLPEAVADHHYEFSRSPLKMYLVERNRMLTVLCDYPPRLLRLVLPMLLLLEPVLLVGALVQGWAPQKLRAWWWLLRHAGTIRRRRKRVQRDVVVPAADFAALLTARIQPPMVSSPPGTGLVNAVLAAYWALVRWRLGRPAATSAR